MDKSKAWVVAYIDVNYLKNLDKDLSSIPEYKEVTAYVPTVRVLKKLFKGKETFEEVPLLFNYGFFSIPRKYATSKAFLDNMKSNIGCIFAWVSDPAKVIVKKPRLVEGNIDYNPNSRIPVATATSEEIAGLVGVARESTIFSAIELDRVKIGDVITLKGYPWEGMDAIVNSIDHKKKTLKVSLLLFQQMKEIQVSFDTVFFTIYTESNYNPDKLSRNSLDDMDDRKTLDKLTLKVNRNGSE